MATETSCDPLLLKFTEIKASSSGDKRREKRETCQYPGIMIFRIRTMIFCFLKKFLFLTLSLLSAIYNTQCPTNRKNRRKCS